MPQCFDIRTVLRGAEILKGYFSAAEFFNHRSFFATMNGNIGFQLVSCSYFNR